jgi:xanthine dehydrogenase accessory factor
MSNRLEHLLSTWLPDKDNIDWVLATVVKTEGSSYRKSGAMMLINGLGQYYGLLSGGCLESDLMRQAKRCLSSGANHTVTYDMREDSDVAWQLGIGCGGMVKILLQPVNCQNDYLQLLALHQTLVSRIPCAYQQQLNSVRPNNTLLLGDQIDTIHNIDTTLYFIHNITPRPLFAIFGGGVDARPLCEMANTLGWQTIVIDERANYASKTHFGSASVIYKQTLESAAAQPWFLQLDAIAILTHNVEHDGRALKTAQKSNAKFVGLLGPTHRTDKVLASVSMTRHDLVHPLSNPIGLDIGGDLPESIALSILSEIHAVLEKKHALRTDANMSALHLSNNPVKQANSAVKTSDHSYDNTDNIKANNPNTVQSAS